jgi:hypothetical protein
VYNNLHRLFRSSVYLKKNCYQLLWRSHRRLLWIMKGERIEEESWAVWRNPKFEKTDVSFCHFHSEKLESTLIIFAMSVDPSVRPSVCILAKTLTTTWWIFHGISYWRVLPKCVERSSLQVTVEVTLHLQTCSLHLACVFSRTSSASEQMLLLTYRITWNSLDSRCFVSSAFVPLSVNCTKIETWFLSSATIRNCFRHSGHFWDK